jgi:ubiquinone/menaquinone biosynthesis C-methylase UbiE
MLRRLRGAKILRPVFFVFFGRSYAGLWDSFAITPGTTREAILAGLGDDENRFWATGIEQAERYVLPLVRRDSVVLDLGAGIGRIARAVAPHCRRIVLVDVSAAMLRRARGALRGVPNAEFVKTGGRSLSAINTMSIDLVYSFLVLQHIEREDVICYVDEVRRVLKPGGVFRFQVPNLADAAQLNTYVSYATGTPVRSIGHMRYYTAEEISVLLPRLGFKVEGIDSDEWHVVTARRLPAQG